MRTLAVLACLGALSSCISLNWSRDTRFEPPPRGALASLRPGESDLARCLAVLGAPLYVAEHRVDGLALAYGWYESAAKGFGFSIPLARRTSASFDFDRIDADMKGCVLILDPDGKLTLVRKGRLRAITADLGRRRPASLED